MLDNINLDNVIKEKIPLKDAYYEINPNQKEVCH